MLDLQEVLWAGTAASFRAAKELDGQLEAARRASSGSVDGEPAADYLLQKQGSIGLISISGSLVNTDNFFTRMFGMSTYPAIREAVMAAVVDPEIKQILLYIDSGGGAVSGASDTANLISQVGAKVKPVTAYVGGTGASAAYWIASSAGKVFVGDTALVGSIGVIATHLDITGMLSQEGIKPTLIRAGKFKALGHPMEPLSDAGKASIQAQVDAVYKIFAQHVADARGVSYAVADQKMGQGQVFTGKEAVAVGLADKMSTMAGAVQYMMKNPPADMMAKKSVDRHAQIYDNSINSNRSSAMTNLLTEQAIAALELGADTKGPTEAEVAAFAAARVQAETAEATRVAAAATAATAEAAATAATAEAARIAAAAPAATAAAATEAAAAAEIAEAARVAAVKSESDLVAFLKVQVAEKDTALLAAAIEARDTKAKLAGIETTHGALVDLVRASVGKMQVALGGSATDLKALTDVQVLSEHTRVSADFLAKFKVGGVAITAPDVKSESESVVADPLQAAKLAAVKRNQATK